MYAVVNEHLMFYDSMTNENIEIEPDSLIEVTKGIDGYMGFYGDVAFKLIKGEFTVLNTFVFTFFDQ